MLCLFFLSESEVNQNFGRICTTSDGGQPAEQNAMRGLSSTKAGQRSMCPLLAVGINCKDSGSSGNKKSGELDVEDGGEDTSGEPAATVAPVASWWSVGAAWFRGRCPALVSYVLQHVHPILLLPFQSLVFFTFLFLVRLLPFGITYIQQYMVSICSEMMLM